MLVTGEAEGRTRVLVYAEGRFTVVAGPGRAAGAEAAAAASAAEPLAPAKKACPGLSDQGRRSSRRR